MIALIALMALVASPGDGPATPPVPPKSQPIAGVAKSGPDAKAEMPDGAGPNSPDPRPAVEIFFLLRLGEEGLDRARHEAVQRLVPPPGRWPAREGPEPGRRLGQDRRGPARRSRGGTGPI